MYIYIYTYVFAGLDALMLEGRPKSQVRSASVRDAATITDSRFTGVLRFVGLARSGVRTISCKGEWCRMLPARIQEHRQETR